MQRFYILILKPFDWIVFFSPLHADKQTDISDDDYRCSDFIKLRTHLIIKRERERKEKACSKINIYIYF